MSAANFFLFTLEFTYLLKTIYYATDWLYRKLSKSLMDNAKSIFLDRISGSDSSTDYYLESARTRMSELKDYHQISQAYYLPFSHLSQIYHLLNLKHLENIHKFSLNNLKIGKINSTQPTVMGGVIKFQTILDTRLNALLLWRKAAAEVELVLHNPYTVELRIPIYNHKKIVVLFNIFPLNMNKHVLYIDIYSDLGWSKGLLQPLLHIASYLTLLEDLPYLKVLASKNLERLIAAKQFSSHETMWLFNRFVDLYSSEIVTF